MAHHPTAIVGIGQTHHKTRRWDVSLGGLVREAASRALEDAQMDWTDIDAIVIGKAPDLFEGVMKPELYLSDALGGAGKPVFRVFVPSQEAMYSFPPQNWALAQLFDGVRSYDDIAELYSAQTGAQYDVDEVREFAASLEEAGFWHKTLQEKNCR